MGIPGCERSRVDPPTLFLFRNTDRELIGMIGVHVDDDLITGTQAFFDTAVSELQRRFVYGKWQRANLSGETFVHCGRRVVRRHDGALVIDQR